jgi:RimJ/RimL family protein N-acetyltransferase
MALEATVREAREAEAGAVMNMKRHLLRETNQLLQTFEEYDLDVDEERYLIRRFGCLDNSAMLIAVAERTPIGMLTLQGGTLARNRHVAQLGIAVRKAVWGFGVGRRLMSSAVAWGRANPQVFKISLLVYSDNERAIDFYERFGFEREGLLRREVYLAREGRYVDLLAMGLHLEDSP